MAIPSVIMVIMYFCADIEHWVITHCLEVKAVAEEVGIGFLGIGFQPKWRREDIPIMPKGRYDIMRNYMPKVGSLGLDMMFRTCTVQIATALFANSPFTEGKPNRYLSMRSHIWSDTDNNRAGMLPFVFDESFGPYKHVWLLYFLGISIGVVTAIAAPASIKVDFEGDGGHAGAALMPSSCFSCRNDAGLAAAETSLAVEKHVLDSGSIDTVGILDLHPRAVNSIPSKAHLEIDTRDIDETRRNTMVKKIHESAVEIAKKRNVKLSGFEIVNQDPSALAEEKIIRSMEAAARELKLDYKLMVSRAYHDSLFMARISPMGMIFIPCYKGYSHKPEEFAAPKDIENGVKVLALTLAKLSLS